MELLKKLCYFVWSGAPEQPEDVCLDVPEREEATRHKPLKFMVTHFSGDQHVIKIHDGSRYVDIKERIGDIVFRRKLGSYDELVAIANYWHANPRAYFDYIDSLENWEKRKMWGEKLLEQEARSKVKFID